MKLTVRAIFTIIAISMLTLLAGDVTTIHSNKTGNDRVKTTITCDPVDLCIENITFPAMHITTKVAH